MGTSEILKKISELPPGEKLFILENTFKAFLKENAQNQMTIAADALETEYKTDKELTIFTTLDFEDFYEAK